MSEGELYKKIQAMFPVRMMTQEIDIEELEKVLDEAKQEFPHWLIIENIVDNGIFIRQDVKYNDNAIQDWFEKWFGGAEK